MTGFNAGDIAFVVRKYDERLPPQKPSQDFKSPYSNKVLCGNWQENLCEYVRHIYPSTSEYRKEYNHPSVGCVSRSCYYDNKLRSWGTDWHIVNDQGMPEEFLKNFSTLYDLSYNGSCPKVVNKPPKKFHSAFVEYRPQQDMMLNFGNTVDYGLRKYKQDQWEDEKKIDIEDALTTYQNTFVPIDPQPRSKKERFHRRNFDKLTKGKKHVCSDDAQVIASCKKRRPHQILPSL